MGTDGGGLHVVDPRTGQVSRYPLPRGGPGSASNAVQSVLAGPGGRIWVGFWSGGLCRIDTRDGRVRFYHPPAGRRSPMSDNIWRVLDVGGGELLVATNDGAFLFDERRESYVPLSDRYPGAGLGSVSAAALDAEGGLWLAHPTGVEHVDRRRGAVTRFEGDIHGGGAFEGSFVDALLVDARGHLWVGTERGLSCLDSAGRRLATYGESDGLPNPNVASITEDASGNVWVGTSGGLARLRGAVAAPAGAAVLAFDERDGVTGRICIRGAAFRSRGGELYFGTSRGLTRFQPEGFQTNTRVPPVVLTGLRLANRPVSAGSPGSPLSGPIEETTELVLSHDQADVTFTFAALNYILPQKNRYTHRLEGLDRDWSPVGPETSASYVRIPPGDYVFRVRACNNDGVWNMDGVRLRLRVRPPFWQTGWFVAAAAVSIVGIGAAAARVTAVAGAPALPGGARREAAAVARAARHARAGPRRDRAAGGLGAAAPRSPPGGGRALPGDRPAHGRVLARGDPAHGQPASLPGAGARRHRTGGPRGRGRADVRRKADGGGRGARRAAPALGRRRAPPVPHRAGGADQRREARAGLPGERLAGVRGRRGGADRVRRRARPPVREAGSRLPLRPLGHAREGEGARDPARGRERAGIAAPPSACAGRGSSFSEEQMIQTLARHRGLVSPGRRLVLGLALVAAVSLPSATAAESVALSVDASRSGAKIDRNLFGQFAEHLGQGVYEGVWVGPDSAIPNTRGIRNDVVAALKALEVPNVRWPGGCFADEYHWRKGVSPQRAVTLNPNWGGVTESNAFGTHEFMDFLDQIGAEAYLSVNVGSGTPQEAAEWLEYLTAAQPTTLAKERAANGRPAPYKIAYLGHRQRELGLRRQHDAGATT